MGRVERGSARRGLASLGPVRRRLVGTRGHDARRLGGVLFDRSLSAGSAQVVDSVESSEFDVTNGLEVVLSGADLLLVWSSNLYETDVSAIDVRATRISSSTGEALGPPTTPVSHSTLAPFGASYGRTAFATGGGMTVYELDDTPRAQAVDAGGVALGEPFPFVSGGDWSVSPDIVEIDGELFGAWIDDRWRVLAIAGQWIDASGRHLPDRGTLDHALYAPATSGFESPRLGGDDCDDEDA